MRKIYEEWKPVKGFENVYQINNWGELKSIARMRKGKNGSLVPVPEKLLKGKIDKDGYIEYALCTGEHKKMKFFRAHRLVAEAFIPNPNNYDQINHINGNRDMNLVDNLEWVSAKQNTSTDKALYKYKTPIIFEGVWYESVRECERQTGHDHRTIKKWLSQDKSSPAS